VVQIIEGAGQWTAPAADIAEDRALLVVFAPANGGLSK
jgi:hypothetical protein